MATIVGKDGKVANGTNIVAEMRSFSLSVTGEAVEDTAMGDDWRTYQPGIKSWSGEFNCWYDSSDTDGQEAFDANASLTAKFYPDNNETGDVELSGTIIVTEAGIEVPEGNNQIISRTVQFQGSGALTEGTVA